MVKVNIYLTFNGTCEEAFTFYKSVFGGEFPYIGRYKDVPQSDSQNFQPENENKIMHVSLPINHATILMGCDNPSAGGKGTVIGDNISISLDLDTKDEADRLFMKLSTNGLIRMAMSETFWGAYFGALTDKFGINWLINCDLNAAK